MDKMILKNYELSLHPEGEYEFSTLPEELCAEMCDCEDRGKRYTPCSRYTYTTKYFKKTKKEFSFGTARAAVQYVLIEKLKRKKGNRINIIPTP